MVVFDNCFLLIALRKNIPASVDDAKERVDYLVQQLQEKDERIIVPTPVLTEVLIHAGEAGPQHLELLQKSYRFKICDYDTRAAVEVAPIIAAAVQRKDKKDGMKGTWAKVNFDRQIAAIGKVEGAHTIYTDDENLTKFAKRMGMNPVGLADLPLPPRPPIIEAIHKAEKQSEKDAKRQTKDSDGIQRSSSSGAGNETEKETAEKDQEVKEPEVVPEKAVAAAQQVPETPKPTAKSDGLGKDGL